MNHLIENRGIELTFECPQNDKISLSSGCLLWRLSTKKEQDEIQILVTSSEDGTINIYDEVAYLNSINVSQQQDVIARRSRAREHGQRRERYHICLTPEDFRPGSRNKKIESIHINQCGLLAAGSDKGDVFLWEFDVQAFKRQQQKVATWLGSSKKHQKTVHFCEFSPNNKYLFTGSIDGTAKIWNLEKDKSKKQDSAQKSLLLSDDKLVTTLGETVNLGAYNLKKNSWQCDTLTWSAYGRYAIAALSGKLEEDKSKDYSIIKVWDSLTGQTIQDLSKGNNIQLMNYSFVIATHPRVEEIIMTGSDGGIICLWNIKTRQLIKKFLEYGIYSYENFIMNEPLDGRFSPDGSSFVVGSVMGTVSLFSCEGAAYKYLGTRVEQFYPQDNIKHNSNIYYETNNEQPEPQVCGYSLIPYEVQPPPSLLGRFKEERKMSYEEYQRNLIVRQELCIEEEAFIQGKLEEGVRNDLFNPDNEPGENLIMNDVEDNDEDQIGIRRGNARARINSQLSQISQHHNNNVASQEDIDALNDIEQAERRPQRGRRQVIHQRPNVVVNPNIDPDNDLYDRDSDENFEMTEVKDESSEEEDSDSDVSEEFGIHTRRQVQSRSNRLNIRQQAEQILRQEESKRRDDSRALRAMRRQGRNVNQEEEKGEEQLKLQKKRRIVSDEEDNEDQSNEDDYEMSDVEQKPTRKRLQRNNVDLPSSDDESLQSDMFEDEESEYGTRQRKTRGRPQKKQKERPQAQRSQVRSLRNRNNRKTYKGMDESSDEYQDDGSDNLQEEEKCGSSKSYEEEKVSGSQGKKRKVIQDESDEEMVDQDVVVPDETLKKMKGDEDYELIVAHHDNQIQLQEDMIIGNVDKKCAFCYRSDQPLIGPFVKYGKNKQIVNGPLHFHKDCIEVNNYSFFSKQKNKWLNIGKALDQFTKKPCMCARCGQIGATIKCMDCYKYYHGHLCSQLYMIWIGGQQYQCFECRNKANFKMFRDKQPMLEKSELKHIKRSIPRDHLLLQKQTSKTYIPQIGDEVYYFFQGHERFMSYYNCFFYSGDSDTLTFEYPWKSHPDFLENPTLCKVISISHRFPTKNSFYLLKKFGKVSPIHQIPQVITKLELEIMDADEELIFSVETFPNELPDFLVMKNLYEQSLNKYELQLNEGRIVGQVFKARSRNLNKVRIVDIQQREPTLYPVTNWETVLYRPEEAGRVRERGRRGLRRDSEEEAPPELMSFWELVLDENTIEEDERNLLVGIFDANDREKIINIMRDYIEKKSDIVVPFMHRVTDQLAPDYRQHISAEMYLALIEERIINNYYRSQEQLYFDLDLISTNARNYNGEDNPLAQQAKKIVDKLKREIKSIIITSEDSKKQQKQEETKISINFSKPIGKLTAPTRYESNMTSMDYFKKTQEDSKITNGKEKANGKKEIQEETKENQEMIVPGRSKRQQSKYQATDTVLNEINVQMDTASPDSFDHKITPKTPAPQSMNNGSRRQTRQHARVNYNDNSYNDVSAFSTEEKPDYGKHDNQMEQQPMLGKRTRSGRNTKVVKQSLNEDESDQEFEKIIGTSNINTSRKRLRHQ